MRNLQQDDDVVCYQTIELKGGLKTFPGAKKALCEKVVKALGADGRFEDVHAGLIQATHIANLTSWPTSDSDIEGERNIFKNCQKMLLVLLFKIFTVRLGYTRRHVLMEIDMDLRDFCSIGLYQTVFDWNQD